MLSTKDQKVHVVETEQASITFSGGVTCSTDFSASGSEEDEDIQEQILNKSTVKVHEKGRQLNERRIPDINGLLMTKDLPQPASVLNGNTDTSTNVIAQSENKDSNKLIGQKTSGVTGDNSFNAKNNFMDSEHTNGEGLTTNTTLKNEINNKTTDSTDTVEIPDTVTHSPQVAKSSSETNNEKNTGINRSPMEPTRFNPFDREVVFEEDYFGQTDIPDFGFDTSKTSLKDSYSPGLKSVSSTSGSFSGLSHDLQDDEFSFADLGLAEDHFSRPEGHFGMSTLEELEMAIQNCKDFIKQAPQHSERQKTLFRKLVHLQMKCQEYKEGPAPVEPDVRLVVGHHFKLKETHSSKHYCEKCNGVIWGMLQAWYKCTECGYHCHDKCLNQITRTCASVKVTENPVYILSICPEKGLSTQNYRCAECKAQIAFKSGFSEPRQCDYSGNFYCELCHWNDEMVIPARVMHNWDFLPRKVCRASRQYLRLMTKKAVLRINDINPMLFSFVEELDDVRKLREEILVMKKYFLSCKSALESKLLLQLSFRQHFVENSDMYSLKDLMDVQTDVLLPEVAKVHSSFAQHIKSDCQVCQGKGFICELCDTHEVLFPFDNIAVVCAQCSYVLHRHCFVKKGNLCPRCERRNKRNEQSSTSFS